ncbi:hypothetical protein Tco_0986959 [Tanacetum coccineum]
MAEAFVPKDSKIEKEVIKSPGFDLQQERSKKAGGSRKKTLAKKRAGEKQSKEGAKRQKIECEKENEELSSGKISDNKSLRTRFVTLGDLKMLFDPDESNELWMNQLDWKLMKWKLHENYGVHTLFMWGTPMEINMLVEKKYPLTKEILKKMLRLQI